MSTKIVQIVVLLTRLFNYYEWKNYLNNYKLIISKKQEQNIDLKLIERKRRVKKSLFIYNS